MCTPSLCVPNTKSGSRTFTRTPLIDMIIEICCWGGKEENTRSESVFITSFICVLRVQTRRRHSAITGTIYASESHKPQPELNADTLIATRRLVTRINHRGHYSGTFKGLSSFLVFACQECLLMYLPHPVTFTSIAEGVEHHFSIKSIFLSSRLHTLPWHFQMAL